MAEAREVQILLSFYTDPKARAAIVAAFDSLGGGLKDASEAVNKLNADFAALAVNIGKVQDPTRRAAWQEELLSLRQSSAEALKSAESGDKLNSVFIEQSGRVRKLTGEIDEFNKGIDKTNQGFGQMRRVVGLAMLGFGLQMSGRQVMGIGKSVFGAANEWAQEAGQGDAVARRWLNAMERIDEAQGRIARTLASSVQPWMDKIADLAEQAAAFAEQHPEVVKAIAGLAAGTFAGGKLMMGIGMPLNIAATGMQLGMYTGLIGASGAAGAAGAGGAAAAAGGIPAIAAVVVAVLAYLGAGWVYDRLKQPEQGGMLREATKTTATIAGISLIGWAALTDELGITEGAAKRAAEAVAKARDEIDNFGQVTGRVSSALQIPAEAVQAFISYRRAEAQAAEQYNQQRSQIETQYAAQRSEIEARYEAQRTDIVQDAARAQAQALENFNFNLARQARDFAANESRIEEDYYRSRLEALQDMHESIQRAEEDHQARMRQMREDHEARLDELVASRDALGIVREVRSYERERRQAEEAHNTEMRRMRADAADRLREMEAQFARERSRRLADYNQRLADQQEDFARQQEQARAATQQRLAELEAQHRTEMQKLQQAHNDKLRELASQYARERRQRYDAFIEQIRDLDLLTGRMKQSWDLFYADMETKLREFIDRVNAMQIGSEGTGTVAPGRASGGYVTFGRYLLGEEGREFVLSASATRAAERFTGGSLTQGRLVAALAGGGGISIGDITFPGVQMTKPEFKRFLKDEFPDALADALQKARGKVRI
jgi:hypothetical protein